MALRISVSLTMFNDGSVNASATYRDTVTGRLNSVGVTIPDPGGSTASFRNAILQAAVNACNNDNGLSGDPQSTTNASTTDIIITNG